MTGRRTRGRHRASAVSGVLFAVACLVVLGLTFLLGMLVGRQWARRSGSEPARIAATPHPQAATPRVGRDGSVNASGSLGLDKGASAARSGRGDSPGARSLETGRGDLQGAGAVEIGRGESPGARSVEVQRGEGQAARPRNTRRLGERERDDATPQIQEKLTFYQTLTAPLTAGPRGGKRSAEVLSRAETRFETGTGHDAVYTVQVASFKSRAQADRLRETLGSDAYVSEFGTDSETRFRVRVGAFTSKADAEALAARLRAERALAGFVTPK